MPLACAALGLLLATWSRGHLVWMVACFMVAVAGIKAYQPAFWSMPSVFLSDSAAAGSIGLVKSVGNLGGFLGPSAVGIVEAWTGSFEGVLVFLAGCTAASGIVVLRLGLGRAESVGGS